MKIKKTRFSTVISDLYGRDNYQKILTVGREFWWNFPETSDVYRATGKFWNKLRITFRRSGCIFYQIVDAPNIGEQFCPVNCFLASTLTLADLDPQEDLKFSIDVELAKKLYCFNDDRTVIHNWDNSIESEVDEDTIMKLYPDEYMSVKLNEIKE
jgi:hypothetical protein